MTAGEIAQLLTAVAVFGNMVLSWRTHLVTVETRVALRETDKNVLTIEKATNSMKDALVEATAAASYGQGEKDGRLELQREQVIQAKAEAKEKTNGNH